MTQRATGLRGHQNEPQRRHAAPSSAATQRPHLPPAPPGAAATSMPRSCPDRHRHAQCGRHPAGGTFIAAAGHQRRRPQYATARPHVAACPDAQALLRHRHPTMHGARPPSASTLPRGRQAACSPRSEGTSMRLPAAPPAYRPRRWTLVTLSPSPTMRAATIHAARQPMAAPRHRSALVHGRPAADGTPRHPVCPGPQPCCVHRGYRLAPACHVSRPKFIVDDGSPTALTACLQGSSSHATISASSSRHPHRHVAAGGDDWTAPARRHGGTFNGTDTM